ncbi:MAG: IS110 family RNA-guided transposase [Methanothrix sp.]
MNAEKEIVCGADIHRDFLVATMISRSGLKLQERFDMNEGGLLAFKSWLLDHKCQRVAVESTGSYWYPIFCILEDHVEFVLANAYQIRNIEGKKTDRLDSERIAVYCLNNLIKPSRIYPKDYRDLRSITRSRETLVNARSKLKNQIHQLLATCCIKLSSVISDSFGKSGRYIIERLLEGKTIDQIISGIPSKRIRKKADELREAIRNSIDPVQVFLIKTDLEVIDSISEKIKLLDAEISIKVKPFEEDLKIVLSVPGIGLTSAATILAEIGDYRDFSNADKLAMYFGIVPSVYQSAGKLRTGKITKRGSKHMRRILVQVAKAISKTKKSSKLKRFFLRVLKRSGKKNVAAIALARKVLCIIYHLLMKREDYQEPEVKKAKPKIPSCVSPISRMDIDEMIKTISRTGYLVEKELKEGCG